MPQGVEHMSRSSHPARMARVRMPLMPQGVEHLVGKLKPCTWTCVRIPLMPQGVEHSRSLIVPMTRHASGDSIAHEAPGDAQSRSDGIGSCYVAEAVRTRSTNDDDARDHDS